MTQESPGVRVSTLELFFDLVFVFTVTQLADSLAHHLTPAGLLDVVLILVVVWWMYSGYAWLTNAVAPTTTTRRTLLLVGMAGFLVMALAIPQAFGKYGWIFGVAYVVVNLSHSVMFLQAGPAAVRVMRTLGPMNLLAALLVLTGGLLPEPWRHLCWLAAPLVQISAGYLHPMELHHISAAHFVERHSLVTIIAIGESIIAIGVGVGSDLSGGVILAAVLGLCVAYYLWWAYFADGDRRSEHVLAEAGDPGRRARLALNAWGYAHIPILLGVVVTAVGIKKTVGHAFEGLHWGEALTLGGGVAIYLLGHAAFLRLLRLPGAAFRVGVAALCLATAPLGHALAVAQLAAVAVVMAGGAILEDVRRIRRSSLAEAIGDFGRGA
ncbi:low temperature requirement protein LtrA [Actinoplanes octamycinicus]|uniref:Low temperature requirement protein LtrA n=1 Tax=Actinoplanes octamycinicus TaxID=135948 RepID=A0A7W7GWL5_9ACTN|nr:low temperature requirement protein A [Actinoplanes octamycinicus]MBB4739626.1 low temperature requirement protein LtrA [Actinoplanes octamycinicus]GIE54809.1 putative low temperature requirement protein A [Actinoplanes octamycinicus]